MDYKVDLKPASLIDPRTKLLLLFMISVFVLGGAGGEKMTVFYWILVFVPVLLLLSERKWKLFFISVLVYGCSYGAQMFLKGDLRPWESVLALSVYVIVKFLPAVFMARYTMATTKVSEFIAAGKKMHLPDTLLIPVSVIFRYFPTIGEEYSCIRDAMKMRGICLGGGKASQMVEYRMVPLIADCTVIGEELSAAALTRGLEVGIQRTCIWNVKLRFLDYLIMGFCIFTVVWCMIGGFFL
ncbi:MAG: energy-coupling factor transporter transmembrane protein EcfT [Lachnospiraceae bacterium]|nr:energy-coupling factor transporter transmembrane protein EcfT [Lachnospiraceae bacterium]